MIPWWGLAYVLGYGLMTIAAAWKDRKQAEPAWRIVLDLLATAALLVMGVAYWYPDAIAPLGRAAAPVLGAVVLWDMYSTSRDFVQLRQDPELRLEENPRAEMLAIVVGAVTIAPMYALAAFAALRPWGET